MWSLRKPGPTGERFASRLLQKKHFNIWHRNWKVPSGELDLIAQYSNSLHIIEVKTRHVGLAASYSGDLAVDVFKTRKLRELAQLYLYRMEKPLKKQRIKSFQFDIIAVRYQRFGPLYVMTYDWYQQAFAWDSHFD